MKRIYIMFPQLVLSLGLIFMVSCTDSTSSTTDPDPTPNPPSAKTMAIDLSIFTSDQPDLNASGDHDNYEAAASSISTIQTVMNRNINVSLNAFQQADTADAEMLGDTKWQWTFTNSGQEEQEGQLMYEFRMVAEQQSDEELKWDLFLSSPALPGDENKYLSGTTNNEVTEGVWTYYSIGPSGIVPQQQQEMAELDWRIVESEDVEIEFQLLGGGDIEGSKMDYSTNGSERMIVMELSEGGETTIQFNAETNAGFIESPDYNSGEKACWNGDFEDVECQ